MTWKSFWRDLWRGLSNTKDSETGSAASGGAPDPGQAPDPAPTPPPKPYVPPGTGVENANTTFDTSSMGVMGSNMQYSGNNTPHW
jgi:hypothetical protein